MFGWFQRKSKTIQIKIQVESKSTYEAEISYTDGYQHSTKRRISINAIEPHGDDFFIKAYCHTRKADRTFKASRVQEFVDLRTGEVITDFISYLKSIQKTG